MKNFKYFIFSLLCLFSCCLVFAKDEITIEKMIPVYEEDSGVIVSEENGIHSVIFNDKDQNVKYNIVLKNNTKRDISLKDIVLPESPEEFFKYEFVGLDEDTVLEPDSTEEVVLSLETVKTEGWGRNFTLDITDKVEVLDNVVNPNTSAQELIVLFVSITFMTGIVTICLKNKKVSRYVVLVVIFGSLMSVTNAKDPIILPIKLNVSFESQNVMKANVCFYDWEDVLRGCGDYWDYHNDIKKIYIENKLSELQKYVYKFDVSDKQNEKVIAYLVENEEDAEMFDLHIQADGVIYANEDASFYFAEFDNIEEIENIQGFDTSLVTDMSYMFYRTGYYSEVFSLDLSNFDTSNVTNMSSMFGGIGNGSPNFTLDVSNFDTSNVTNMSNMFAGTGIGSPNFTLDVSNFDTSKVTDMCGMFFYTGNYSEVFSLDLSNFDTSNVTNMSAMFYETGYSNPNFILDVSNFDTSKVTDMNHMFYHTGYNSPNFTLDVSNFDTSNVTDMGGMFWATGYSSPNFTLDVSNFDISNVTNMRSMFYKTGYNSTKLNTSITIRNPNIVKNNYEYMFRDVATKSGSKITVNYTSETEALVDQMIATKTAGANVVKGKMIIDVDNLSIGDEVQIENEMFNVISQTDDTITMLAQYNLGTDYRQNSIINYVAFSDNYGWEYTPGPKEIDIQKYDGGAKTYINEYTKYLKSKVNDSNISGNLITLQELKSLGCDISEDYSFTGNETCSGSQYISWLVNSQSWWTCSANNYSDEVRVVNSSYLDYEIFTGRKGVRPVITISKNALKDYLKT